MKKFSPMRFTAPTEEAALAGALQLVGASRDEADYEVLETTAKGVTVRVKPKSLETSAPAPQSSAEDVQITPLEADDEALQTEADAVQIAAEAAEFEDDETFSEPEIEDAEGFIDSEIEAEIAPLETQGDYDEEDEESDEDSADEEIEMPAPVESASPETLERAREAAQSILERMGLDAQAQIAGSEGPKSVQLVIEGGDIGILIGKQGATLQSFQYILNLTLNNGLAQSEGVRVSVDAGNYRARRQSSLEQTARMAAQRARASGRPVRLEPMPASERRIIHMYLQSERGISTQSEGREPQRRLVVSPEEGASGNGGGNGNAGSMGRYENRGSRGGGFGRGSERGGRGRGFRR